MLLHGPGLLLAPCPWITLLLLLLANKLSSLWLLRRLLRLSQAVLRPRLPSWVGLCMPINNLLLARLPDVYHLWMWLLRLLNNVLLG